MRHKRRLYGRALPPELDRELAGRVRRLCRLWWVEMRYRGESPTAAEVNRVYDDVTWLRDHHLKLWR